MKLGNEDRRILCLWLPNWPVQRLVVEQPELKCQHIVLFRQDSRRGQLVAAASPLALRAGAQVEMPLSEAKSLLSRQIRKQTAESKGQRYHILPYDPTADLYAIEKLADELDSFSPIIGLQQETQYPDCVFLDVTGLASLFGGELDLAQKLYEFCNQRGYLTHIAIANTIAEAQGIAQFQCGAPTSTQKNLNIKIANEPDLHLSLPISALRLADWISTTLNQLGIRTIGQLLSLPRKDLSARFGNDIHHRIDQMTGAATEPIIARKPIPDYYAEKLLDYPTSHQETIEVVLERLIEDVCKRLTAAQQGALQWTIRLYCQNHKLPMKLFVSLFHPTATVEHIIQLARMQMEQLLHSMEINTQKKRSKSSKASIPFEIIEISVSVTSCVLITHRQRNLFDENPRLDKQSLAHLINRLSGRLGRENVVYPSLVSGAQPEKAFQMKPLINPYGRGPRRIVNQQTTQTHSHVLSRPLKMFQPAIALKSIELTGTQSKEKMRPPALLTLSEQEQKVINFWGPERIETGWWRGPTVRRDYWRVETETHQQYWIYNDLRKRSWFLQGEF